ncbi:phage portal protein [Amycolatopsis solani]|uniref:phage portal protein n=1 Tax=Amycolatopsis solani TaxID=3028615 RepID=UPI0025B1C72E|nr:phage portal protein [Amycolatopsis sp. MEP2-6]
MGWIKTVFGGGWRDAPTAARPRPPRVDLSNVVFELNAPEEIRRGGSTTGPLPPRVGRAEALSVGAVKRARDLICGTLGTLPIRMLDPGRRVVESELFEQPEIDIARSVTITRTVEDMLFEGRSWWRVTEFGWHGFPTKVRRLEPRSVLVQTDAKVYVNENGRPQGIAEEIVPDSQLIRIDSPNEALLTSAARAIRMAIALDQRADQYTKDPLPLGFFTPADGFADQDPDEIQPLLDTWEASRSERSWGYVGAALKPEVLQWDPEKLQLSSARDYAVLEIARHAGIDPEDLGVSTTSRTYANAEQRRLDLVDFTLAAYVSAIETRLSMRDVVPGGHKARVDYNGFLRSDTKTRMETYKIGREVGVYNDQRIAEIEQIPDATPQPTPKPAAPTAAPAPAPEESAAVQNAIAPAVTFDATAEELATFTFGGDVAAAEFAVDSAKRTITGLAVPWNQVARSGWAYWKFQPGSLIWSDVSRVKMFRDHDYSQAVGVAIKLEVTAAGLVATLKVARGAAGDEVLSLAEDGVLDGLSIGVFFDGIDDAWQPDPADESVRLVTRATLREVSITAMPAFDSARVTAVTASQTSPGAPAPTTKENPAMTAPAPEQQPAAPTAAPAVPAAGPASTPPTAEQVQAAATLTEAHVAQLTAGMSEAMATAVAEAFARLPFQQQHERQVVPAGRAVVTREAPVYSMNGTGPSLVKDSWNAHRNFDSDARERLLRFEAQTKDIAHQVANAMFAANTTNAAAVVPPGYRPDLYVAQLMKGRPLVGGISHGALEDATPFTIPSFASASGMSSQHTEGTNPTPGTLTLATVTVTPKAISGGFTLTREIVDSSNPAIDAIAMQAMGESYSQQTEAMVYAELNGANGQGGTITNGFVPSGAQVSTSAGGSAAAATYGGKELIAGVRLAEALYPFRRFAAPTRGYLSQEGTSAFATAVDSDGRPLLPSGNPVNTVGTGNASTQSWEVDGLTFQPAWSMGGNAAGDADALMVNEYDAWAWESGLLTFRYEERNGPANIDLALFGYFATRVLRPVGIAAVRHTVGA